MQTDIDILQSKTIDWLRFPMAVAVVILHHSLTVFPGATGPVHSLGLVFQEGICRLAVPCFFMISGYLLFSRLENGWDWNIWRGKLSSRIRTLVVPYLLWNLIAFLVYWGYSAMQGPAPFMEEWGRFGGIRMFWSVKGGLPLGINAYPVDGPLWFIRDLIFYVAISPLLYVFFRWTGWAGLVGLFGVHLLVPGIVPEGFMFFSTGVCLRLKGKNIVGLLRPVEKALYIVALTLLIALYFADDMSEYWTRFIKVLFLFTGIGASFCGAARLLENGRTSVVPFLVKSSFFIFAFHEILLPRHLAGKVLAAVYPFSGRLWDCLEYFITPALIVAVCLGVYWLMDRYLPAVSRVLNGGRKVRTA